MKSLLLKLTLVPTFLILMNAYMEHSKGTFALARELCLTFVTKDLSDLYFTKAYSD